MPQPKILLAERHAHARLAAAQQEAFQEIPGQNISPQHVEQLKTPASQSFQKAFIKEYALNHTGVLVLVEGIFLISVLLEALGTSSLLCHGISKAFWPVTAVTSKHRTRATRDAALSQRATTTSIPRVPIYPSFEYPGLYVWNFGSPGITNLFPRPSGNIQPRGHYSDRPICRIELLGYFNPPHRKQELYKERRTEHRTP